MLSKLSNALEDWRLGLFFMVLFGGSGFANYLKRNRFSVTALFTDVFSSVCGGFLTYFFMQGRGYDEMLALGVSFLVAHNGTALLFIIDRWLESKATEIVEKIDK